MAVRQSIWSLDHKYELPVCVDHKEIDIEDICYEHIEILNPDWLVIGRQIKTAYGGFIDLLCMDSGADLIIVELKRGMTPREVTAQAIDYASWVSTLESDDISNIYEEKNNGENIDQAFKEKFGSNLFDNDDRNVKMVIVATSMDSSTERIVRYLTTYNLDINILIFSVFTHNDEKFLSRAWLIEENEAEVLRAQVSSKNTVKWNGEFYISFGADENRSWEDARKFGFISAGGGKWYTSELYNLQVGNRVWVNIPHTGYVGVGEVLSDAELCDEAVFDIDGKDYAFYDLPNLQGDYLENDNLESDMAEHLVKIKWLYSVPLEEVVSESGFFGNQHIVCKPTSSKWIHTLDRLKKVWGLTDEKLTESMI